MSSPLVTLATVFVAIVVAPLLSRRIGVPAIVLEVAAGIVIGKSLLDILVYDPWLDFLADFGLIFLLFLAGLEVGVRRFYRESAVISLMSFGVPFLLGSLFGHYVGINALYMGALLSTTSVGVVLPTIKEVGRNDKFGRLSLESALLVDVISMFLFAIALEVTRGTSIGLITMSLLFAISLFSLPVIVKILDLGNFVSRWSGLRDYKEYGVRMCFALVVFFALIFEFLGFHAILGAFLAGLIISELTGEGHVLRQRCAGLGYGFFIPIFFVVVGATTNLRTLLKPEWMISLLVLIMLGISGKILGVAGACKALGLTNKLGVPMGVLHASRLSLVMAGAKIGLDLGLLNEEIFSTIVVFSIITVLVCPSIFKALIQSKRFSEVGFRPPSPSKITR